MSTVEYRFIEPLDVLFLRGNKLFGDPGSYGESLIPPWPSVAAGAIRSRMLADDGIDLAAFAKGGETHATLGTPEHPGSFAITAFTLALRTNGGVEMLVAPPADLVIGKTESGEPNPVSLTPTPPLKGEGLACSSPLPWLPVLAEKERHKPATGYWLKQSGWKKYLRGETPTAEDIVSNGDLWQIDPRVGVGLDPAMRRAADGKLFTVQAVALRSDVGFLAGVTGAHPPADGLLRLGGDGRAAAIRTETINLPETDYDAIAKARRCRLVLTTPGIFGTRGAAGWLPTGTSGETADLRFDLHGVRGLIVCAAAPRAEVVSGWDLANGRPKPAKRAAPTGSVWWLNELDATPDALRKLVAHGLWSETCEDASRRAEGFNRVTLAAWK